MTLEMLLEIIDKNTIICTDNSSFPEEFRKRDYTKEALLKDILDKNSNIRDNIVESIHVSAECTLNINIENRAIYTRTLDDVMQDLVFNESLYINTNNDSFPKKYRHSCYTLGELYQAIIKNNDKYLLKSNVKTEYDLRNNIPEEGIKLPSFATYIRLILV